MHADDLRVLIIDGHLAVGRGLKALVEEMPGLRVVGLCTRGERGLAQAARTTPDVALVDADLPGLCSAAVIRLLRWRLPRTRVVALGTYAERRRLALAAGAHEFALKDAGYEALRSAIVGESGASGHGEANTRSHDEAGASGHTGTFETVKQMTASPQTTTAGLITAAAQATADARMMANGPIATDAVGSPTARGERILS